MPAYLKLWDTAEQDETNWNNLEILVASGCFVSWVPEWVLFARSSFDDFPLTGCARWFAAGGCHLVNNEDSTSLSLGGTIVGGCLHCWIFPWNPWILSYPNCFVNTNLAAKLLPCKTEVSCGTMALVRRGPQKPTLEVLYYVLLL